MRNKAMTMAVAIAGGQAKLARQLNATAEAGGVVLHRPIRQSHIHYWLESTAPGDRCLLIEMATNGAVTRYELRPDVYGEPPCQAA